MSVLQQTLPVRDTIVVRTIPEQGFLDWTNGVLELVVLLLAVGALLVMIKLMLIVGKTMSEMTTTVDRLTRDFRPLLEQATALASDARETIGLLREDVERVGNAAAAISDELLNAADSTARRVDDVNAVLDVIQAEFEDSAISAMSTIRGLRTGAAGVASRLMSSGGAQRKRPNRYGIPRSQQTEGLESQTHRPGKVGSGE